MTALKDIQQVEPQRIHQALYRALVNTQYAIDPLFRPHARWVMNKDWLDVIDAMCDAKGYGYRTMGATHMLGLPLKITEDGGAPHLEWTEP